MSFFLSHCFLSPSFPPLPLTISNRLVETVKPHLSAQYYFATAEIHEIEEKYRDAAKAVRGALNMYTRAREYVHVQVDLQIHACVIT